MSKINHSQNEQISQNENKQSLQIITPEEEKNNHIFGKDSKNQLDDDDFMLSIPKKVLIIFQKYGNRRP